MQQQRKGADLKMRSSEDGVSRHYVLYVIKNSPYFHVTDYFIPSFFLRYLLSDNIRYKKVAAKSPYF